MTTISLAVSSEDYEAFREASARLDRPIAALIREAMAQYRRETLERRTPLRDFPVLVGLRPRGPLPTRYEIYDEIFASGGAGAVREAAVKNKKPARRGQR